MDDYYSMHQKGYILKIANPHNLDRARGSKIPLDTGYYRSREGSKAMPDNREYQCLIGALLYVAVNTRPDVVSTPTEADWVELKSAISRHHKRLRTQTN